jgi:hypothetical protein
VRRLVSVLEPEEINDAKESIVVKVLDGHLDCVDVHFTFGRNCEDMSVAIDERQNLLYDNIDLVSELE